MSTYPNRVIALVLLLCTTALTTTSVAAAVVSADWVDETQGTLGGVSFTVTNGDSSFPPVLTLDLFGSDFSAAPLNNVEVLQYRTNADITFTFDQEMDNLLLYARAWRGAFYSGVDDPASTYTLSTAFTVESGFTTAAILGNSITIDDDFTTFENGILKFLSPVISLTIDYTPGVGEGYGQFLTFGIDMAPVPIPGAAWLFGSALFGLGMIKRREG